jgi:hypothetical protein
MATSHSTTFLTATAMGVLSHVATLDVVWDFKIWLLLKSYATGLCALLLAFVITLGYGPLSAIAVTIFVSFSFNIGVLSSMVIYRLFFHRLRKFPGPFWAKITRFYPVYVSKKSMQYFLDLQEFHRTYGDVVRTGKLLSHHARYRSKFRMLRASRLVHSPSQCGTAHLRPAVQVREVQLVRRANGQAQIPPDDPQPRNAQTPPQDLGPGI